MRLLISRSYLHDQNNSPQSPFYTDRILWPMLEADYAKGVEKMFTLLKKKIVFYVSIFVNNSCYPSRGFFMKQRIRTRKHYDRVAIHLN